VLRLNFRNQPNTLELVAESPSGDVLEMPDNLTFAPSGHLYVCEDGSFDNYIRRITPDGRVVTFARNARSDSEFAGVCFSPDGDTMFVNIQEDHLTLAITGPFEQDAASDSDIGTRTHGVEIEHPWNTPAIGAAAGLSALALAAVLYRRRKNS
jgi:secreted PhoX family phosphatase